jgi:DNA-binding response OmpR family regulator
MNALHQDHSEKTPCLAGATSRILVIDDDACIGRAIQVIMTRHRCETVVASRAHAGIHAFQASEFGVVIVDLFMPGMNGLDTIKKIRSESEVPIIAMSGFGLRNSLDFDQDFLGMAKRHGATTSLRKPFSPPQLVAAIGLSRGLAPLWEI